MHRADTSGWVKDGNLAFFGGCDSSIPPSNLQRTQVARAYNCTARGGPISHRPGWKPRPLQFKDESDAANFKNTLFQHGAFYSNQNNPSLISSHGGRQWLIDLNSFTVQEITPSKTASTTIPTFFSIPVSPSATVTISVGSTAGMTVSLPSISIGGYPLNLVAINSPTQITVSNPIPSNNSVIVVTNSVVTFYELDPNDPTLPIGWSVQMGTYWVYQDNQSWPIIFNGSGCRRSDPAQKEIPVGNVMGYADARLIVALPDRHTYRVGDLLFGPSGTQANGYRDAVLKFTENDFLNEGGDFQARVFGAPSDDGPITAIKAVAMTDTQLGQGPLMIGTPYNVFTVNLPFDRTTWKDLANPQQTNSPLLGPTGQDTMVLVNTDVWYRSIDGIRSYIMAQRQFRTWGNTPMSAEIGDILSTDTQSLLEHGSAVLFDNRLLTTVSPTPSTGHGVYHLGLAVMDFNLVSTISQKIGPVWEGIWTDLRILKILKGMVGGNERCFAYVLNCHNEIELWELTKDSRFDGRLTPITWSFEAPSYNCGNSDQFKRLETSRIIINNLLGTLNGRVTYRSDQHPCWTFWDTFNSCAKMEDCCTSRDTTTVGQFSLPMYPGVIQITVASTEGMSADFTDLIIGGFTASIVSVNSPTLLTITNLVHNQDSGVVQSGTKVTFCGYDCAGPHTFREQARLIRLHSPPDTEDEVSGHYHNRAYEFQPRIELVGSAEITQLRIFAKDEPEILGADRTDDV